jgi:anti-sigma regulatory factor (Ser/Thr protein kinase)
MPRETPTNTTASPRLRLEIRSNTAEVGPTRRTLENFAAQAQFDEVAVHEIGLCINEALANIIRHAYDNMPDRPIVIAAEVRPNAKAQPHSQGKQLWVTIRDWGKGHNPADRPAKPHVPLQPGGLGMICLKELMDKVAFEPQPDGMLLTLVKKQHRTEN